MVYIIILISLIILVWNYDVYHKKDYKWSFFWGLCFAFILYAGLRYRIGGDTIGYMTSFEFYPNLFSSGINEGIKKVQNLSVEYERFRPGWIIYVMLIKTIWNNFFFLQFITAIILNCSIFYTVRKYSDYPFMTLLIFFLNFRFFELEFEIMRESVAVSIFMIISISQYVKKNWILYYLGSVVASCFHPSAYITFLFPIFRYIKLSKNLYILIFCIVPFIIGLTGRILLGNIVNILLGGEDYVSNYVSNALDKDFNNNYIIMYSVTPIVLSVIAAFGWKRIKNDYFVPLLFFTISLYFSSLIYFSGSRLSNYIIIISYISITPIFISMLKRFKTILFPLIVILSLSIPNIYTFFKSEYSFSLYFPYQNCILKGQTPKQKQL